MHIRNYFFSISPVHGLKFYRQQNRNQASIRFFRQDQPMEKARVKVAVIGSRTFHPGNIDVFLPKGTDTIISGGAMGADQAGQEAARRNGLKLIVYYPDYKRYGRGAPLRRNAHIIRDADLVLVFWDTQSRGTLAALELAKKAGKEVRIITQGELEHDECSKNVKETGEIYAVEF